MSLMNEVRRPVIGKFVVVYFDDIVNTNFEPNKLDKKLDNKSIFRIDVECEYNL